MTRRHNAHLRCRACRMHGSLCVCSLLPRIETRTRVVLVIHRYEARKPTNTGQLAASSLTNSEVVVRGHESKPSEAIAIPDGAQPLFLFPHEDAVPIARFAESGRPATLIVPDGTWRQASKVRSRVPGMRGVPCVSLPHDAPSFYRLRAEAHPTGLATIEAIARALYVLEGSRGPEVRAALERVMRAMVDRTLWSRGEVETQDVTGGVPEGVMRHDPRSGRA